MPNFKLDSKVKDLILTQVRHLTERRVDYALADFPLTVAGVQEAVMEPTTLSLIRQLEATGYNQAPMVTDTTIFMSRAQFLGLHRMVPLNLMLPEPIHTSKPVYYHPPSTTTVFDPSHRFDGASQFITWVNLDAADSRALVDWVNNVVRERRLQEITLWTATGVLAECAGTAHVLAAWPLLATLVDDPFWKNRFRQPTRKMTPYALNTWNAAKFGKAIQAADVVLTGAELLEDYKHTPGVTRAYISQWERLPNDRRYDLP